MKRSLWAVSLLLLTITVSGAICRNSGTPPKSFTLNYWTVDSSPEVIKPVIDAFALKYPYITIEVKKVSANDYESNLIQAWAQGTGPDIFSLPNKQVGAFTDLISPLPVTIPITSVTETSSLGQKQTVVTPEKLAGTSPRQVSALFPQVVYDDVVKTDKVYGLPMSLDTLVLYYNKDMLSRASIAVPATTWVDFIKQVPKLTKVDINNNIIESGASLGTTANIPHVFDIVSLLMMEYGATMNQGNQVLFSAESKQRSNFYPGSEAVKFYTSFADPKTDSYSWSASQPDARENFIAGKSAYFVGYYSDLATIQNKGANLKFDLAPIPQIDANNPINYAQYSVETVSINSKHPNEAWAFLQTLTTDSASATAVNAKTKLPAALKSLLVTQQSDFVLSIFANQALTAKSWYNGPKPLEVERAFTDMIDVINAGRLDAVTAVQNTADKVQLTYKQ